MNPRRMHEAESPGRGAALRVLMAPDYRAGNPYQRLLADGLEACGVEPVFAPGYRRILPLCRMLGDHSCDLLHLHWPDAYYREARDGLDSLRAARFPIDLALSSRLMPVVATAHNLHPHNRPQTLLLHRATRAYYRRARRVIVHGRHAPAVLEREFGVDPARCRFVPHGDLSVVLPPVPNREAARAALGLDPAARVCLMFGSVEPYKGIEEAVAFWNRARPAARLVVAGAARDEDYGRGVAALAEGVGSIDLRLGWLDDPALAAWLAAADVVVFNYRAILVSGAATLARSLGVPILLPSRLDTIDLDEPHPQVFRFTSFEEDFPKMLDAALKAGARHDLAADWRELHAWGNVAAMTRDVYREALGC